MCAEPRFTRDIDLAVAIETDAEAEALVQSLMTRGYLGMALVEHETQGRLATARMALPAPADAVGVILDLLFASSGIEGVLVETAEAVAHRVPCGPMAASAVRRPEPVRVRNEAPDLDYDRLGVPAAGAGNRREESVMLRSVLLALCCVPVVVSAAGAQDAVVQQAYLKASNTDPSDGFGGQLALAVSGDTVVVGAMDEGSAATGVNGDQHDDDPYSVSAGAVYVFVRNGASWSQQAYLKASNTDGGDRFGSSVAISGDTIVVGAPTEFSKATGVNGDQTDNSYSAAGAAYVFVRSGTNWTQQAYLKASNTQWSDHFGNSVAVSGDTIVVGAIGEGSNATGVDGDQADNSASGSGAAYVFVRDETSWSQQAYLKASNSAGGDQFGGSVAVSDDTVAIGAFLEDSKATGVDGDQADNSASYAGAAYVFARNGTTWSQQAYLKASNTDPGDLFGKAVAVSGDTVVVGAKKEDSKTKKVNGNQGSNAATSAGAAYVFVRTGTTWSQQAYVKPSNTDKNDWFGDAVAVSDDTLVIGAQYEDSKSIGVNGASGDAGPFFNSGAAYVFVRSGTTWSETAYLKASNTEGGDLFGVSVAVSGDTILVGAEDEDSDATGVNGIQVINDAKTSGAAYVFDLGAWADMAGEFGGASDKRPTLVGTGTLADGSDNAIALSYAGPNVSCALFVALSSRPVPFKGGTLMAFPPFLGPLILATNPDGTLPLSFRAPPGLPSGSTLWLQFAIQDAASIFGVSLSNAIVGTSP